MDIEKIINDKVKELVDSKAIENTITSSIEKTILDETKRIFSGYDFSHVIRELIKRQIGNIAETIKLNSYNSLITQTIEDLLNNQVQDDLCNKIKTVIEKQFLVTEKEIKLSDVVKAIKDDYCSDDEYICSVAISDSDIVGWSRDWTRKRISFFFKEDDDKDIVIELRSDYKSEVMRIDSVKYESFDLDRIQTLRTYDKLECLLIKAYLNKLPFVIDMSASECEEELYQERDC